MNFPAEGDETVVTVVGWKVESPWIDERENVVSGVANIRRAIEKAWMMLTAMIWLRKPSLFWERYPPRIGVPQVKKMLEMLYIMTRRDRSWTCLHISNKARS